MDIDRIIDIVHTLKEEGGPTMSLGAGGIAGTVEAGDDPPVDLRRRKERKQLKHDDRRLGLS
jgi:hypothetical protein